MQNLGCPTKYSVRQPFSLAGKAGSSPLIREFFKYKTRLTHKYLSRVQQHHQYIKFIKIFQQLITNSKVIAFRVWICHYNSPSLSYTSLFNCTSLFLLQCILYKYREGCHGVILAQSLLYCCFNRTIKSWTAISSFAFQTTFMINASHALRS